MCKCIVILQTLADENRVPVVDFAIAHVQLFELCIVIQKQLNLPVVHMFLIVRIQSQFHDVLILFNSFQQFIYRVVFQSTL